MLTKNSGVDFEFFSYFSSFVKT